MGHRAWDVVADSGAKHLDHTHRAGEFILTEADGAIHPFGATYAP